MMNVIRPVNKFKKLKTLNTHNIDKDKSLNFSPIKLNKGSNRELVDDNVSHRISNINSRYSKQNSANVHGGHRRF